MSAANPERVRDLPPISLASSESPAPSGLRQLVSVHWRASFALHLFCEWPAQSVRRKL